MKKEELTPDLVMLYKKSSELSKKLYKLVLESSKELKDPRKIFIVSSRALLNIYICVLEGSVHKDFQKAVLEDNIEYLRFVLKSIREEKED
jgi:hypothetical protein